MRGVSDAGVESEMGVESGMSEAGVESRMSEAGVESGARVMGGMRAVLSIDQSTSATKALLWGLDGRLLARADVPHRQIANSLGWAEHDPMEIWGNAQRAARLAIEKSGIRAGDVAAVGIANQRETAVCWDAATGAPLHNAIVWRCARASDIVEEVRAAGLEGEVRRRTGTPLSPYFSAAKFGWMVRHSPEAKAARVAGRLRCGTVDSWLVHRLTGEFLTDCSNASRTQLMDLRGLKWDAELAAAFGLSVGCLPEIRFCDSMFGTTTFGGLLPRPVPVRGVMGDSHAALFGNQCWRPFDAKATYGTGSSVMMNAGERRPEPAAGISASVAWAMGSKAEYALEGNVNDAGSVIRWLADGLGLLADPMGAGEVAASVPDTGGVYLVPAFSGLGAPHFDSAARAAFLGMNRGTGRAHLVRAAEECIAYQVRDVAEAMKESCGKGMAALRADGGPTGDGFLMQFQADILDIPLEISETEELSGMGAAFCAAEAAGLASREALFAGRRRRAVRQRMAAGRREELYSGWKNAVRAVSMATSMGESTTPSRP
ncbi:MAG: glycerol kinase [Clostridiales bacterium]|jgi:glycerol kinase|nr:glycerol kinase [Clostridiales bacterium]